MTFVTQDLEYLKQLARIQFDDPIREADFFMSMERIVDMLEQVKNIDTTGVEDVIFLSKTMDSVSGQDNFADSKALLANVAHPLMNNSVVVKSVLE